MRLLMPVAAMFVLSTGAIAVVPTDLTCGSATFYCVEASSSSAIDCALDGDDYACTLTATLIGTGSTATPSHGHVRTAYGYREFAICGSGTICIPETYHLKAECRWLPPGNTCTFEDTMTLAFEGTKTNECLTGYVLQSADVIVDEGTGLVPFAALATARDDAYSEYEACT